MTLNELKKIAECGERMNPHITLTLLEMIAVLREAIIETHHDTDDDNPYSACATPVCRALVRVDELELHLG